MKKPQRNILLFSILWLLMNLIQSYFTEITGDESYYWVYSKFLDWGYYDHPPMIALLIKLGTLFTNSEIGVRLFSSLMGAGTIFILLNMIKDRIRNWKMLFIFLLAIPLLQFHVAGFLATPDVPLVFFTTCFFFSYRRYLEKDDVANIALLALSTALMLYSKYHGFLIIGFTVLSNLKLFLKRSFWLTAILSGLLFMPHILWQVKHDFASFSYQLYERSTSFEIKYLLNYISIQLLLLGPFTGLILLTTGVLKKAEDKFEKALKFSIIGFFVFFLFSSLRGHVEAHWTAAAYIPLLLFSLPELSRLKKYEKILKPLGYLTILLILFIRIALITRLDIIPDNVNDRFHSKKEVMHKIENLAEGEPVVFTNSYRDASLYWYFTGSPSTSYDNIYYHRTQYDIWNSESDFQGRRVLYITKNGFDGCDTLRYYSRRYIYHFTDYFCSYNRVEIDAPDLKSEYFSGEKVEITLKLNNTSQDSIYFNCPCTHEPILMYTYFLKGSPHNHKTYNSISKEKLPDLPPYSSKNHQISIQIPENPGKVLIQFSISSRNIYPGQNSKPVNMSVLSRSISSSENN